MPWSVDVAFNAAVGDGTCSANGVVGWGAQPLGGAPTTCNGDGDCALERVPQTFPEAIVIGVANTMQRTYELTPHPGLHHPRRARCPTAAEAPTSTLQMLTQEAHAGSPQSRPFSGERTDVASTAMCGSSLGGLCTAYAGLKHPQVFGLPSRRGLSPSTWWDNDVIVTDVMGTLAAPNRPLTVYVDSGNGMPAAECRGHGRRRGRHRAMLAAAYLALGYVDGTSFRHVLQPMACHSETYWAQRFPGAAQFLLGTR